MPIDPAVFGFSNVWDPSAIEHATQIDGPDGPVPVADAVHVCATKIEAFLARSGGDLFHHDMEDLIAVVDARVEPLAEISKAASDVRDFISEQVGAWLDNDDFLEALAGHLAGDAASQARRPILLARLRQIAAYVDATASGSEAMPAVSQIPKPAPIAWGGRASVLEARCRRMCCCAPATFEQRRTTRTLES